MRRLADVPKATRSQLRVAVARNMVVCIFMTRVQRARVKVQRESRCLLRRSTWSPLSSLSRARNAKCAKCTRYVQSVLLSFTRDTDKQNRLTIVAYRLPAVARGVARRRHPEPLHASPLAVARRCRRHFQWPAGAQCSLTRDTRRNDTRKSAPSRATTRVRTPPFTDVRLRNATVRLTGGTPRPARRYLHARRRDRVGVRAVTGVGATFPCERG